VIPLEGGYVMVKKPRDFGGLLICTHQRDYVLKFETAEDLVQMYQKLQQVVSKEVYVDRYLVRKKEQDEKVSNLNKYTQYKKIVQDIEDKLIELKKLCSLKKKFEKSNHDDEDIMEYIETTVKCSSLPQLSQQIF
jgi:hypothetical protein